MASLPLADANGYRPLYVRPILYPGDAADDAYRQSVTDHINGGNLGPYNPITFPTSWDVVLTDADSVATIEAAISNAANINIGFAPGDYRSKGTINVDRRKIGGAPVFIGSTDGSLLHPYQLPEQSRVLLKKFYIYDCENICLHRLAFDAEGDVTINGRMVHINADETAVNDDIVVSHCYMRNGLKGVYAGNWRNQGIVVQYCLGHEMALVQNLDTEPCEMFSTENSWVSSCEFVDGGGDCIVTNGPTGTCVFENCDLYFTDRLRCNVAGVLWDGIDDISNYPYLMGEQCLDMKGKGNSYTDTTLVTKCRLWGRRARPPNNVATGSGSVGVANWICGANQADGNGSYHLIADCIIGPGQRAISAVNRSPGGTSPQNNSFCRNLFILESYDDPDNLLLDSNNQSIWMNEGSDTQMLFNTILFAGKDLPSAYDCLGFRGGYSADVKANIWINTGAHNSTYNGEWDYNVYVNAAVGNDTNFQTYTDQDDAGLVDFAFFRRLITGPESVTIPKVLVPTGSPIEDYAAPATHITGHGCLADAVAQGPEIP